MRLAELTFSDVTFSVALNDYEASAIRTVNLNVLFPGWFRGVCPAGSYPLRRGLPAHPGHGHGRHAGEDHHHQEGLHHLGPGHLRARRRLDGPRPRHHLRSLGRHHRAVPLRGRARHLPRRGPPRLHQPYHGPQHHRLRALRHRQKRAEDSPGLQVSAGHHRYPGYGRVVRGGQAQGRQGQED